MADRRRGSGEPPEGSPEYNWLYGGRGAGRGESGSSGDPDPTRVLPTSKRPTGGAGAAGAWTPAGRPDRPSTMPPARRSGMPPAGPPLSGRRPRFRLGWLKIALLLWVVFLLAVPVWAWTAIHKVNDEPRGHRPDAQPGHTYLLVGSDSRAGLTKAQRKAYGTGTGEGRRTDTIMLLHTGSGPDMLMSIPRDSLVDIPGVGTTKINAAFSYGGPRLLVKTIELNTGIRVDSYVEIGFGGFVNVVDAVGGIKICPKQAMKDKLANLDVKKGCQQVDGPTALGYARSRHVSQLGDIDRAAHQREVVSAVGDKAVSPWSVLNPVRYVRLAAAGADSLRLGKDTGPFDTIGFAWAMTHVTGKKGLTCGVPISDLAVHWDSQRAPRMFKLIREDRTADIPKSLCSPSGLPH